jgi:hypothetical protein
MTQKDIDVIGVMVIPYNNGYTKPTERRRLLSKPGSLLMQKEIYS